MATQKTVAPFWLRCYYCRNEVPKGADLFLKSEAAFCSFQCVRYGKAALKWRDVPAAGEPRGR